MARLIPPLAESRIRNAKPGSKNYKLFDGGGLYLEVTSVGSKLWRMKFRQLSGKESRLSFGKYPEVSLQQARRMREEARRLVALGVDPRTGRNRQEDSGVDPSHMFESVTREWLKKQAARWKDDHDHHVMRSLERDVFPYLGKKAVADITPPQLLSVLRRVENRGAVQSAYRLMSYCSRVFRYAIATGLAVHNPADALRGALTPVRFGHYAAITDPRRVAWMLRLIDDFQGTFTVACALKLAPLFFVRPGELRMARWKDIDFVAAEWRYTISKTRSQHIVPLSRQALAILRDLKEVAGSGKYVFPGVREGQPISINTLNTALRRMGIEKSEMTAHGFRAMARTILDEVLGVRPDLIEHQLAHAVKDPNGRAYNRTSHLPERRKMMQQWADYLDELRSIPLCPD